ncbi:HD-GYP domain-containing protein [Chromobacterium sp. IIBBL 290-4]|uniref:HD-GYP domain-containing protein n=1 Tax=Chromobacterium sp. IIBBL 290-4 TaxID=2953890 RepID=UPI0020B7A6AF|nr:HD domain-containing phosphohydrolase [Chromobacterium sp. IIBBL 290-4]UTH76310.1 HD domain-containing protein [Chromobacterium sp. IIBBL 290-4]
MRDNDFTLVNPFWLNRLIGLQGDCRARLAEDVLDQEGRVLLSAGDSPDGNWPEKLGQNRLRQPLEKLLQAPAFEPRLVLPQRSRHVLQDSRFLQALLGQVDECNNSIAILKLLPLKGPLALWLAAMRHQGELDHALRVCLLSIGIARQLNLSSQEQQQIALAALLHDIGELYIDPAFLAAPHTLQPEEWRHIVNHPVLGCQLLLALGGLEQPRPVALAILQHHERLDGSGYPLGTQGDKLNTGGQILMLADTICQLLGREPFFPQRIDTALKILPGEFDYNLVSMLCKVNRLSSKSLPPPTMSVPDLSKQLQQLLQTIGRLTQRFWAMKELDAGMSPPAMRLLDDSMARFNTIQRAITSTGASELPQDHKDEELSRELWCVIGETRWRLRNLARQVALHIEKLTPREQTPFQSLAKALMEN